MTTTNNPNTTQTKDFFWPRLDALGYDGAFRKRPRDASPDGCGLFWRRDKFELVATDSIEARGECAVVRRRGDFCRAASWRVLSCGRRPVSPADWLSLRLAFFVA